LTLELERGKLAIERAHLLGEILVRLEAARAGIGVHPEIADQQRRGGIEPERGENGAEALAHDHGATIARARLRLDEQSEIGNQKPEIGRRKLLFRLLTSGFPPPISDF